MCYVSFVVSVETQAELFTLCLGDRLDLACSAKDSHAVNWTKDHVAVVDGEHTRIRNGQLEIEAVELTDSGLYACTTFGNHSLYFNVTGKVMETAKSIWKWTILCSLYRFSLKLILSLNSHVLFVLLYE